MKDKEYLELFSAIIYQFLVLISIIVMNVIYFYETQTINEFMIGALVGVMVGLPMAYQKSNKDKKEV